MTDSQLKATFVAIYKVMPELKGIEYHGNPNVPVIHEIIRVITEPRIVVSNGMPSEPTSIAYPELTIS